MDTRTNFLNVLIKSNRNIFDIYIYIYIFDTFIKGVGYRRYLFWEITYKI